MHAHDVTITAAHEPAAAGSRTAELITTTLLLISMILSWIAFVQVGFGHHDVRVPVFTWIASGDLKVDWSLRIDTLTAVMLVVVNTVSAFVHLYSIGYMDEDPYRPRFFAYLSMFTFVMLMLVTADNLVQMFFGWEGVGLASYLLIGFWYHKPEANAAAIKAFVVNRVGDFGFALGIFALFMMVGAVDFDTVFAQAPSLTGKTIWFFGWHPDALTHHLPAAVHGRDGQVGAVPAAHLAAGRDGRPDAGLGADPRRHHGDRRRVHGGAPVAAVRTGAERADLRHLHRRHHGDFRRHHRPGAERHQAHRRLFDLLAARLHVRRHGRAAPIRSACSICSRTPSSRRCCSSGSGSVIHAMHHEQDIRHMGGLKDRIPFTYIVMIIGTLALTGFPLTAGYFSKDAIIEAAYRRQKPDGALCLHLHGRGRAADVVLFLAPDLQDLPRRAARPQALEGRA